MAMTIGSVSIGADGTASGSGAKLDLYDGLLASVGADIPAGAAGKPFKDALAASVDVVAGWVVDYIQTNAQIVVTTSDSGMQRSALVGSPTNAPSSNFTGGGVT